MLGPRASKALKESISRSPILPTLLRRYCVSASEETISPSDPDAEFDPPDLPPSTTPRQRPLSRSQLRRGKNLFELADLLPERGLGVRFVRDLWIRNKYENSYWTITKIRESVVEDGWPRYYGKKTWKGVEGNEMRVKSGFKRGWEFLQKENGQPKLLRSIRIKKQEKKVESS